MEDSIKLAELLKAVRDENLTLQQTEGYRDDLIHARTDVSIEIADLKKKRAMFMLACEEKTNVAKKLAWEVTEQGQRLIELEGYYRAMGLEIDSLKGRIFGLIR